MFQFTRLPLPALLYSGRSTRALPRVGFPIRTSRDRRLVSTSPGLFAAAHVLHRLLAPRHPPCALHLLIVKNTVLAAMEFSRCARTPSAEKSTLTTLHKPGERGLSKLNSVRSRLQPCVVAACQPTLRRGRRCSRRAESSDDRSHQRARSSTSSAPTGARAPVSLERR
jgi:hypothetical protein